MERLSWVIEEHRERSEEREFAGELKHRRRAKSKESAERPGNTYLEPARGRQKYTVSNAAISIFDDMVKMGCTQEEVSSALHHVLKGKKGYSTDALYAFLFETDKDRKRRQMRHKVTEVVNAHRLDEMKTFITQHELTMWRRENGFDLQPVVRGKPPPTREEDNASLWLEVQELKDAISMPAKNPDLPPDSYVTLEDKESEGVMSPTLEDNNRQSSLADTGIGMPEQQSIPQGENWEAGLTKTGGSVLIDLSPSPGVDRPSPLQRSTPTSTFADIFEIKSGEQVAAIEEAAITQYRKETSDENKQFDPGGGGETFPFPVSNYFFQLPEMNGDASFDSIPMKTATSLLFLV